MNQIIMSDFDTPRTSSSKIRSVALAHTVNGRAYRVCGSALAQTRAAVVHAMGRMGLVGLTISSLPGGERVNGGNGRRTLEVDVEKIGDLISRVRATARIGSSYDTTTAVDLIAEVVGILDGKPHNHRER